MGLVNEHEFDNRLPSNTPIRIWWEKAALGPWVVAPITITMAATPADPAGGGGLGIAASSTGTTTAEVRANFAIFQVCCFPRV